MVGFEDRIETQRTSLPLYVRKIDLGNFKLHLLRFIHSSMVKVHSAQQVSDHIFSPQQIYVHIFFHTHALLSNHAPC